LQKKVYLSVLLISTILAVAFAVEFTVASSQDAPKISKFHSRGYTRINIFPGAETPEFYASETTFLYHGWATANPPFWDGMGGRLKREFLKTSDFRVWIDGTEVKLNRYQWIEKTMIEVGPGEYENRKIMYVLFWIVFEPYYFVPDKTYEFYGEWYSESHGIPVPFDNTAFVDALPDPP
jgi:hypothetical protein